MTLEEHRISSRVKILDLAGRHGTHNVRVFGSVARGDCSASSDVDLLVDSRTWANFDGSWRTLDRSPGSSTGSRGRCDREDAPAKIVRACPTGSRAAMRDDSERLLDILSAIHRVPREDG